MMSDWFNVLCYDSCRLRDAACARSDHVTRDVAAYNSMLVLSATAVSMEFEEPDLATLQW